MINPQYGPAISDFARYLILFKFGGVYLDNKSFPEKNLNEIIKSNDKYLLSYWEKSYPGWGNPPDLKGQRAFQQWFIITVPSHPFLGLTISNVMENIDKYNVKSSGVGKYGVLRLQGQLFIPSQY